MLDQPVDAVNAEIELRQQNNDFYEKNLPPQIISQPAGHQKSFNAKTTHFSNIINNNHQSDNISEHCFV